MLARGNRNGVVWGDVPRFVRHAVGGRWFMAFASLLIMSMSGLGYMFSIYSNDVKASLGYDQTSLNLLSFFKDLGGNFGIVAGLLNELSPPWVVLSIGAATNLSGYLLIWLSVTARVSTPRLWMMCLYIFVATNSLTFSNTGALATTVVNFPESRGVVLGLLKGYIGLSGAILAQLYRALYGRDSRSLILLLAWLPAAVCVVFLRTIRKMKAVRQANELRVFYDFLYISLALAGFLMLVIVLQTRLQFPRIAYCGCAAVVCVLLFAPIFVVAREELGTFARRNVPNVPPAAGVVAVDSLDLSRGIKAQEVPPQQQGQPPPSVRLEAADVPAEKSVSCAAGVFSPPERGEDYTILQAICSVDMLTLFTATACGVGGAMTAIDNLGQIGRALGYPAKATTTFVSLVSIWNYLGRVAAGFLSEILLKKYKLPRPLFLTSVLLLSCVGYLLIAFDAPNSLYFASVIVGFCLGAQWPLLFAIISELFGLKYYSTLFNVGSMVSPVGAYVLNVKVAGKLYDDEARRQMAAMGRARGSGEELSCAGARCYRLSFIIISAATLFGSLVSAWLVVRTRGFYKSDIYKKFREEEMVAVTEGGAAANGGVFISTNPRT